MSTVDNVERLAMAAPPILRAVLSLDLALTLIPFSEEDAAARAEVIKKSLETISDLGVDAAALVRFGLPHKVTGTLVAHLVLQGATFAAEHGAPVAPDLPRWRRRLALPADPASPVTSEEEYVIATTNHLERIRHPLQKWVENGPIQLVTELTAPTAEEFALALEGPEPSTEVLNTYRWAADRLAEQDVTRWPTPSLNLEYQWIVGELPQLLPECVMSAVSIELTAVEKEIARRAVRGDSSRIEVNLLLQLQSQAKAFLRAKRHAEASALFAFYARFHEDDALAHNNYAFCLIPTSPEVALESLDRAQKRGYPHRGIMVYNKACCLVQLSREGEALDLLEYYWQREIENEPTPCTLWRFGSNGMEIYEEVDPRRAIANLGATLAKRLVPQRESVWRTRQTKLGDIQGVSTTDEAQ